MGISSLAACHISNIDYLLVVNKFLSLSRRVSVCYLLTVLSIGLFSFAVAVTLYHLVLDVVYLYTE